MYVDNGNELSYKECLEGKIPTYIVYTYYLVGKFGLHNLKISV